MSPSPAREQLQAPLENSSLGRAFAVLFTGGLAGKILGLGREVLLAALFGTSSVVAAFRVAQTATFVPVNFFTADALNAGFLPLHARFSAKEPDRAHVLYRSVQAMLLAAAAAITVALVLGRAAWIRLLAPGFDDPTSDLAASLLLVMALGVPFYVAFSMLSFLEMSFGSYRLASTRATIQSLGLIAGTLAAFHWQRPTLLAWGFTGAYVLLCIWGLRRAKQLGAVRSKGRVRWPEARPVLAEFWQVIRPLLMLPILLQGTIAAERAVATLMGTEVTAALDYARLITETGIVLLASPLAMAGLSTLSRGDEETALSQLRRVLPPLLLCTVPISVVLALSSSQVISLVYERGRFTASDVEVCSQILAGLAIGFWAQIAAYFLVKALNARLRNKVAMRLTAMGLLTNLVADLALFKLIGPAALGLGAALGSLVLFVGSAHILGLLPAAGRLLLLMLPGTAACLVIASAVPDSGLGSFALVLALMALCWIANVMFVPQLRKVASPWTARIRIRRNRQA